MRVQEIQIDEKKRYVLIDENNNPVIPVFKYLKYLDNIGKAENTLKAYCRHLKLYFQFLKEVEKEKKQQKVEQALCRGGTDSVRPSLSNNYIKTKS